MSRKWASCSTRGRVTFANDLLAQPEEFRREVIVHELLHLKVPNHGPLFRALLLAHLSGTDSLLRRSARGASGTRGFRVSGQCLSASFTVLAKVSCGTLERTLQVSEGRAD